jgi:predicted nucleic acid-binding protein
MNVFFDSSAWVKRYVEENDSKLVEETGWSADKISLSIICLPEVISAFTRLQREGRLTADQTDILQKALYDDIADVQLIQINEAEIAQSIRLLKNFPLRTLDALHLACALAAKVDLFVSADLQQTEAARGSGLKTLFVGFSEQAGKK